MTTNLVFVDADKPIMEAVQSMRGNKIGAILVKDPESGICGIFTERDFLNKIDLTHPEKLGSITVADVMTKNLKTVDHEEQYSSVLKIMQQFNIRHMPVSKDGEVVGLVSIRDLMNRYDEIVDDQLDMRQAGGGPLNQQTEIFRTIFDKSAVAISYADANECIISWNPFMEKMLGMTKEDLLNKPVKDLYPPEEWENIRSMRIREYGQKQHLETKVKDKNGKLIDVDISISVIKDEKGQVSGSIGVMRDIRTRKRLDAMLENSVKELEDLRFGLDEHAIVSVMDIDGKMTYVNDKFCDISQYSQDELVGNDHYIVNAAEQTQELVDNFWSTIRSGQVWKGEVKNEAKDKSEYWLDTTIVPFLNREGKPYQYIVIQTDITTRKKNEEALKLVNTDLRTNAQALRAMVVDKEQEYQQLLKNQNQIIQIEKMATLGTLAAGFAHEIKNPLAIILQSVERVDKLLKTVDEEKGKQYVKIIRSAATRATKIVTSILLYSRSSQIESQLLNVHDVIDAAVELVTNTAKFKDIEIIRNYLPEDAILLGDKIMLQQVFFDLMSNAFDAMPDGGDITIDVSYQEPEVPEAEQPEGEQKDEGNYVFKIKDQGEGIDEQYLTKIFDPFFTTKDEGEGTGLGLSTVYLIIQRHNGTIRVESEKGMGTIFIISLPKRSVVEGENERSSEDG